MTKPFRFCRNLVTSLLIAGPFTAFCAGSGGSGPGGGNTDAIKFRALARTSLEQVIRVSKDQDLVDSAKKILEKVDSNDVNVVMVDYKLYYLGGEVDALNYPDQNRIEVNQDRINQRLYTERLQLAIHEFAGLALVPDVNNVISSQLSNPAAFKMVCTVDIIADSGKRMAHLNMVPQDNKDNGKVTVTEYTASAGDVFYTANFNYDNDGKIDSFETDAFEIPGGRSSTYRNLSYGWAGRTWAYFNSVKFTGDSISIECYDSSFEKFPRPDYQPDFNNLNLTIEGKN